MRNVFRQVLSHIRPTEKELKQELEFATVLVKHIQKKAPRSCQAVLSGSVAKKTFLRDKRDIDIFVLFPRTVPKETLEARIIGIFSSSFPGLGHQLSYAEHPYVRFRFEGRRIDLVPAYKISDAGQRLSAVDRSVLHTRFVRRWLRHRDDVLLLKAFLQANSLYGAEIKVQGLSGYLCELLIIRYKGFAKLARAAAKWKPPVFIDLARHHKGRKAVSQLVERFGTKLVVIDPTDPNRNVAAALSAENFRRFSALCRRFLKKPSASLFLSQPEGFEEKAAKLAKGSGFFLASMPRPDVVDDVLWGQLHRMMNQMREHLEDFEPRAIIADDKEHIIRIAIILGKEQLPKTMVVAGPPVEMLRHAEQFRRGHRGARFTIRKGRVYAEVKRHSPDARPAIMDFFKSLQKTKSHLACSEELIVLEHVKPRGPTSLGKRRR